MWKVNSNFKRSFVPHLQKKRKEKSFLRNLSSASFFACSMATAAAAAKQVTDVYHDVFHSERTYYEQGSERGENA